MRRFLRFQFPLLAGCTLIFFLSSLPALPEVSLPFWDKFIHGLAYGVLGILAYRAFLNQTLVVSLRENPIFSAIMFNILYGMSDEIHQYFVPGRTTEAGDLAADIIGTIVLTLVFDRVLRRRQHRQI